MKLFIDEETKAYIQSIVNTKNKYPYLLFAIDYILSGNTYVGDIQLKLYNDISQEIIQYDKN